MPGLRFDVQGARNAGYSDSEIADLLGQKAGFDSGSARNAGYSDQAIIERLIAQPTAQPAAPAPKSGAQQVAEEQGVTDAMLIGAGRTFDRIGKGMQQLYYGATGNDKELAALKQRAAADDEVYKPLQEARPFATAVGEAAPSMVIPIGGTGTALATAGKLAASAAAPELLKYGSAGERASNAVGSGIGAVVGGQVVPKAVQMAVAGAKTALKGLAGKITPEAMALAARAKELGIPVNLAQLSDSKFLKTLNSIIEQTPFTGGAEAARTQRNAYNRAVAKTFGEDVDTVTPDVYNAAKKRIGSQFDELTARNELSVDDALKSKMGSILESAESTANDDTIRAMRNIASRVSEQAESSGGKVPAQMSNLVDEAGNPIIRTAASETPVSTKIPGKTYASIDSELSNMIKSGGEKGVYAKRMRQALREGMDASISATDKEAWDTARGQYKNLKAVRNIVAKDAANGDIPPTQLVQALNSTDAGKEAMAMGTRGTLGELGQIGRQFVRDQIPNSGTAQRMTAIGLLGGGGYLAGADPKTIAGLAIGGATTGRILNRILNNPKTIEKLAAQGISIRDLANMPASRLTQILGGTLGEATAIDMRE